METLATKAIQVREELLSQLEEIKQFPSRRIVFNNNRLMISVNKELVDKQELLTKLINILNCIIETFVSGTDFKMPSIWKFPKAIKCFFQIAKELINLLHLIFKK